MIISPEVFYNVTAILHIAMLVLVVLFIVGHVIVTVAKLRAIRSLKKELQQEMEDMTNSLGELPSIIAQMNERMEEEKTKPVVKKRDHSRIGGKNVSRPYPIPTKRITKKNK